jgi:hypothetical protein
MQPHSSSARKREAVCFRLLLLVLTGLMFDARLTQSVAKQSILTLRLCQRASRLLMRRYPIKASSYRRSGVIRWPVTLSLLVIAFCVSGSVKLAQAQEVTLSLRVPADAPPRAFIEGTCKAQSKWSFVDSSAGIVGLGARIENFEVLAPSGQAISTLKLAPGQYSSAPATKFKYEVSLAPPVRASDGAKTSWVSSGAGLLMLRDLLPLFEGSPAQISLRMSVPSGWSAYWRGKDVADETTGIDDADDAVVAVGNRLRASEKTIGSARLSLIVQGDWAFTDTEAMELAAKVYSAHRDVFGAASSRQVTLVLFSYPQQVRADHWSAETRGATVTLLMGKVPSKVGALAQLSTPFTHELFHLWVPNGLALDGNYDWFYEGFTVYQAAMTAVRLDLLTFPEFLTAIGRAYDGYLNSIDRDRWSLIEASAIRWTAGQSAVYAKSMVVAFLFDLRARSDSRGKRSIEDIYRKLFLSYRLPENGGNSASRSNGNEVLIKSLLGDSATQDLVRNFISKPAALNLSQELAPYGLTVETLGLRTRVAVSEQLSKQQRDLLRQLGYNDALRVPRRSQKN